MRNGFPALLSKEAAEVRRLLQLALCVFGLAFLLVVSGALAFTGSVRENHDPGNPFTWFAPLVAIAAAAIGFWQTYRESRGDMWTFALHRPVSGGQIFAAKFITGAATLLFAAGIPYAFAMWWLSVPGHSAVPFDRSYWLPGIADYLAALTWYAGGLYAGSRRVGHLARMIGFGLALAGSLIVIGTPSFAIAAVVSVTFTALLAAAAWSDFISGSDFDAQPLWGRAANVLSAIPAVGIAVFIVGATTGFVMRKIDPKVAPPSLLASGPPAGVTRDGRIVMGETFDSDVIRSGALATDPRTVYPAHGASYRNSRPWVAPLFSGIEGAPLWYYERRSGLISVYDWKSGTLYGWIGPDGLSKGTAKPVRRFAGQLQMKLFRKDLFQPGGLLVLSTGVYSLDDFSRPRLVFAAPDGETILQASEGLFGELSPGADAAWGDFNVVLTTARMYVLDTAGSIQLSVAHPAADSGRRVKVYRAPYASGAPTLIWYAPRHAYAGDTLSHVLEFRRGSSAPVAEYRFAGVPFNPFVGADAPPAAGSRFSPGAALKVVPAAQVYSWRRERAKAVRDVFMAVLIGLLSAGFAFWLCRRFAFSQGRTMTWTALGAVMGPIALVLMWLFLEWPAHETCGACGKPRVVSRERCEHCDSAFGVPEGAGSAIPVPG